MERLWQWMWDRHGPRYTWAAFAVGCVVVYPIFALALTLVVAFQDSDRYVVGLGIAAVATAAALYPGVLPGSARMRLTERWAAGEDVDREAALEQTYRYARESVVRGTVAYVIAGGTAAAVVAAIVDAGTGRIVQWAILGCLTLCAVYLIAAHSFVEALLRPARTALGAGLDIGDALPRSRPSFATWSNTIVLGTAFVFTLAGAIFGGIIDRANDDPVVAVLVAAGMTIAFALPITVAAAFSPSLRPIRDLTEGTARVAAGDYGQRLPVVQDDDLGVLAASFNRMQAGLAERQRLQAAFGSYVDPALAARLLEQGDDVFTGERREVTVMFVDVRDFTPFAEANAAEDVVAHLNELFGIIVPAVLEAGGHVNKYLGDGALAVFGAPNTLESHADAAMSAATTIERLVAERFAGTTRVGIGINTGEVIAGTIGGGGKLEFTLIGDTVNVAARVEQLTKTTGDTVLLTERTLAALSAEPGRLADRGAHELKGKAAPTRVFALSV